MSAVKTASQLARVARHLKPCSLKARLPSRAFFVDLLCKTQIGSS
jgi:hypothetical protein